jgi:catechol 2,3-dioxygenase-like lactoylglutathione lyase family enzyme
VFRGIQHCAFVVSDLESSRRFYRDALGLTEIPRPASFAFAGAWFQAGTDEVHLIVEGDTTMRAGASEAGPALGVGLVTHLALEVDDLAAMLARLNERGIEIGGGPMPRGDGVDQAFFLDPDGYVVEVFERTGKDQSDTPRRMPVRSGAGRE